MLEAKPVLDVCATTRTCNVVQVPTTRTCNVLQVLETKRMLDGALRAEISAAGSHGVSIGWMTLIMKDGSANATYLEPQRAIELPSEGARAEEPVAQGTASGGAFFVF